MNPVSYLARLSAAKYVLWCYLIWWFGVAVPYFDPNPALWASSLGIAVIIGTGLYLSTAFAGPKRAALGRWAVARLYMMPFFVSSFAALIKGRGFVLVFHPSLQANLRPLLACALFGVVMLLARRLGGGEAPGPRATAPES